MRISDWSSDVCSSDLFGNVVRAPTEALVEKMVSTQLASSFADGRWRSAIGNRLVARKSAESSCRASLSSARSDKPQLRNKSRIMLVHVIERQRCSPSMKALMKKNSKIERCVNL